LSSIERNFEGVFERDFLELSFLDKKFTDDVFGLKILQVENVIM
jgi:hypothetical protein